MITVIGSIQILLELVSLYLLLELSIKKKVIGFALFGISAICVPWLSSLYNVSVSHGLVKYQFAGLIFQTFSSSLMFIAAIQLNKHYKMRTKNDA